MNIADQIMRRADRAFAEASGRILIEDLSPMERKAEDDAIETKARYVRTPAGVRRYKRPIGSIILPRGMGSLDQIRYREPKFKGFDLIEDRKGNLYDIGKDPASGGKYVVLKHNTWDDQLPPQDTLDKALEALNEKLGGGTNSDAEEGEKPAPKTKKPAPKKTPGKEPSSDSKPQGDAPASDDNVASSDPRKRSAKFKRAADNMDRALDAVDNAKTEDDYRRALVDLEKSTVEMEDYIKSKGSEEDFARSALPKIERAKAKARSQIKRMETKRKDQANKPSEAPAPRKAASKGAQGSPERDAFIESHPKIKDVTDYHKPKLRGMSEKNFEAYVAAVEGGKSPNSIGPIMDRIDAGASWNPITEKWVGQNSTKRPTSPTPTGDTSAADAADAAVRDRVQKMKDADRSKGRTNPYTSSLKPHQKDEVDALTPGEYATYMNARDAGEGHISAAHRAKNQPRTGYKGAIMDVDKAVQQAKKNLSRSQSPAEQMQELKNREKRLDDVNDELGRHRLALPSKLGQMTSEQKARDKEILAKYQEIDDARSAINRKRLAAMRKQEQTSQQAEPTPSGRQMGAQEKRSHDRSVKDFDKAMDGARNLSQGPDMDSNLRRYTASRDSLERAIREYEVTRKTGYGVSPETERRYADARSLSDTLDNRIKGFREQRAQEQADLKREQEAERQRQQAEQSKNQIAEDAAQNQKNREARESAEQDSRFGNTATFVSANQDLIKKIVSLGRSGKDPYPHISEARARLAEIDKRLSWTDDELGGYHKGKGKAESDERAAQFRKSLQSQRKNYEQAINLMEDLKAKRPKPVGDQHQGMGEIERIGREARERQQAEAGAPSSSDAPTKPRLDPKDMPAPKIATGPVKKGKTRYVGEVNGHPIAVDSGRKAGVSHVVVLHQDNDAYNARTGGKAEDTGVTSVIYSEHSSAAAAKRAAESTRNFPIGPETRAYVVEVKPQEARGDGPTTQAAQQSQGTSGGASEALKSEAGEYRSKARDLAKRIRDALSDTTSQDEAYRDRLRALDAEYVALLPRNRQIQDAHFGSDRATQDELRGVANAAQEMGAERNRLATRLNGVNIALERQQSRRPQAKRPETVPTSPREVSSPAPARERVKGVDSTISLAKTQAQKARRARTEKSARDHINTLNSTERDLNRNLERSGDRMPADQRAEVEQALQEIRAARAKAEQNIPLNQRTHLRPEDLPALRDETRMFGTRGRQDPELTSAEALHEALPSKSTGRYQEFEMDVDALDQMVTDGTAPSVPEMNRAIRAMEAENRKPDGDDYDEPLKDLKRARDYIKDRLDRERAEFEAANTSLFGDDLSIPEPAPAPSARRVTMKDVKWKADPSKERNVVAKHREATVNGHEITLQHLNSGRPGSYFVSVKDPSGKEVYRYSAPTDEETMSEVANRALRHVNGEDPSDARPAGEANRPATAIEKARQALQDWDRAHAVGSTDPGMQSMRFHETQRQRDKKLSSYLNQMGRESKERQRLVNDIARARREERDAKTPKTPVDPSIIKGSDRVLVLNYGRAEWKRVKRVNKTTVTVDGGGGGMDDPRYPHSKIVGVRKDGEEIIGGATPAPRQSPAYTERPGDPGDGPFRRGADRLRRAGITEFTPNQARQVDEMNRDQWEAAQGRVDAGESISDVLGSTATRNRRDPMAPPSVSRDEVQRRLAERRAAREAASRPAGQSEDRTSKTPINIGNFGVRSEAEARQMYANTPRRDIADIPKGGNGHIGNGIWVKRCPVCGQAFKSVGAPGYSSTYAKHVDSHGTGIAIPGYNVGMLS